MESERAPHPVVERAEAEVSAEQPRPRPAPSRIVQRKLAVGSADDPLEHEADRVADRVVRVLAGGHGASPGSVVGGAADAPSRIRRATATIGAEGGAVDADFEQRIRSATGTPLAPTVRAPMESAFGADFSGVRVHAGNESTALNDRIQAKAFTAGSDVFFRGGLPDTSRPSGQHLLAHELAHVVQQTGRGIHRSPQPTKIVRRKGGDGKGGTTGGKKDGTGGTTASTPRTLAEMRNEVQNLQQQKLAAEQELAQLKDDEKKANVFKKLTFGSKIKAASAKAKQLGDDLQRVRNEMRPLELQEAEEKRIKKERREQRKQKKLLEQQKKDSRLKTYAQIAALTLGDLMDYLTGTPDWHERSTLTDPERALIREVESFGSTPEHLAPCAAYTIAAIDSAASSSSITVTEALVALTTYVRAAGDQRTPFEVSVFPNALHGVKVGRAIDLLLAAFPVWVLKAAMKEEQFLSLLNKGYIPDLIAYYQAPTPPVFQAENGADFKSYLNMRTVDGVDPVTFQSGPLVGYVRNFHRFPAAMLKRLELNLADTSKKLPLTLVLHSAIDHNGAFHRDPNMTAVVTSPKNLTLMIEGGETLADYKSLITPIAAAYGNNGKIDQVMFAGHGGSRIIELAGTVSENTVDVAKRGTLKQDEEPIDLDGDPAAAQDFFDEILKNMDQSVVTPLVGTGPKSQPNRRILFNACLTNSNEVFDAVSTSDRKTARKEIREYITNNASLATYMAKYAKTKGSDVVSLGANASITQVELIDTATGQLDLKTTRDPKVTASKLEYVAEGTEPHGVLLAVVEAWANDPAATLRAMGDRCKLKSTKWDDAVIEGIFALALQEKVNPALGEILRQLSGSAHALSSLKQEKECRVSNALKCPFSESAAWAKMVSRLALSTLYKSTPRIRLVMQQAWAGKGDATGKNNVVQLLEKHFDAKSARDFVDVKHLVSTGVMADVMADPSSKGKLVLALIGVLDPAKPAVCVEHLRRLRHAGAPKLPMLPEVNEVPEVKEQPAPRPKVGKVPAAPGRAKVDEIPGKRPAAAEIPDLPELPELPAVAAPKSSTSKSTKTMAPGRPGRPARAEVPELAAVKPFLQVTHDVAALLNGRGTEDDIIKAIA